jgi:hypothetical protein
LPRRCSPRRCCVDVARVDVARIDVARVDVARVDVALDVRVELAGSTLLASITWNVQPHRRELFARLDAAAVREIQARQLDIS